MLHNEWLKQMDGQLREIENGYPGCPSSERPKWRKKLMRLKEACDRMLHAWASAEERIAALLAEHPELSEEALETDEVWISDASVRRFRQAQGYYGLTMYREAEKLLGKLVEHEPDFLLGRLYLGLTLFQSGKTEEAETQFRLVAETADAAPFVGFARHMLGCVAVRTGDDRRAIREFSKAAELCPDDADSRFNLGACHYRLGEYHEAIPRFYEAISLHEDDWEAMYYLSACYREARLWESVMFWRMASYEKANHPAIIESIAHDWEEMGHPEEALKWYHRLLEADPKCPGAYHGIAWNLWAGGNRGEAFMWLKKGLSLFPDDPGLLFTHAWLSLSEGDLDRAEKSLAKLADIPDLEPFWLAARSRLSADIGETSGAIETAERLINMDKREFRAMGHYQKGRILLESGNTRQAADHFRMAGQLMPHWRDPLFFEGVCHLAEGKPEVIRERLGELIPLK